MSTDQKIYTKIDLVNKLKEVALKQKEKNDLIIAEKDKVIAEKDALLTEKNNIIAKKDEIITEKENLNRELDEQIKLAEVGLESFKDQQEKILNNIDVIIEEKNKIHEKCDILTKENAELQKQIKELENKESSYSIPEDYQFLREFYIDIINIVSNTNISEEAIQPTSTVDEQHEEVITDNIETGVIEKTTEQVVEESQADVVKTHPVKKEKKIRKSNRDKMIQQQEVATEETVEKTAEPTAVSTNEQQEEKNDEINIEELLSSL